jgi:hypothetical protein
MLLAGLKSKHISALSVYILCCTNYTSRKLADMVLFASEEADIRATETERNTERLRITAYDICSPLARSLDHCER